jgi:hypothetical protein
MAYSSSIDYDFSEQQGNLDNEPDHIYYNANIVNQNSLTATPLGKAPVVQFQETRSTAIVSDVSKYNFSITRFTMNGCGRNLPLFIPQIQVNGGDRDLTAYGIGLDWITTGTTTYKGIIVGAQTFYAFAYVKFVSEFINAYNSQGLDLPFPPTTTRQQNIASPYYYVMSYQWWLDLVNNSIRENATIMSGTSAYYPLGSLPYQFGTAWNLAGGSNVATFSDLPSPLSTSGQTYRTNDTGNFYTSNGTIWVLQTDYPVPSWASTSTFNPPSFLYKGTTFTILVPYTFCLTNPTGKNTPPLYPSTSGDRGNMYFNTNMYGLFANLNFIFNGGYTSTLVPIISNFGKTYQLIVEDLNGTNYYFPPTQTTANPQTTAPVYLTLNQEYNSTSQLWSPIESIVFTSTLLPLYSEQVGAPIVYGEGNNTASANTSSSAFTPIITDVALALNTANDYRDFIEYAPTAEYRLTSFTSSKQEVRAIDIQVFWKSRLTSTLVPVTLYNGSSVSLKVLFRKKGVGKKG